MPRRALVQISKMDADSGRPVSHQSRNFVGRHFELQAEQSGFGEHDGRARHRDGAHNDHEMGAALRAGVRETMETARPTGRRHVAEGRETYVKVRGEWLYL